MGIMVLSRRRRSASATTRKTTLLSCRLHSHQLSDYVDRAPRTPTITIRTRRRPRQFRTSSSSSSPSLSFRSFVRSVYATTHKPHGGQLCWLLRREQRGALQPPAAGSNPDRLPEPVLSPRTKTSFVRGPQTVFLVFTAASLTGPRKPRSPLQLTLLLAIPVSTSWNCLSAK